MECGSVLAANYSINEFIMKHILLIPTLVLVAACGVVAPATREMEDPVNVGYSTVDRKDLTTSVSVVKADKNPTPYRTIYEMIQGQCPGVEVEGTKVRIRGVSSINSPTDPLFVVDGIIQNGGVDYISPNDVKSITVLKDAASCAIYGSQGANGVILIDLK